MLKSFVDESGHSRDPKCRFVGLAGFVANEQQWEQFDEAWGKAIIDRYGGRTFHAKEFFHHPEWPAERRVSLLKDLTQAIEVSGARAVGCCVYLSAYEDLATEYRGCLPDPYYMAFQEVTKGLALSGSPVCSPDLMADPVSMVYAFQKEYGATEAGRAMKLWHTIKQHSDVFPWGAWMGTYTISKPEQSYGLQAADLFAYELTREFEQWKTNQPRPMRLALKEIIKRQPNPLLISLLEHAGILEILWNGGVFPERAEAPSPFKLAQLETGWVVRNALRERAEE